MLELSIGLILGSLVFGIIRDHSGCCSRYWTWFHNISYLLLTLGIIAFYAYMWRYF